MQTVSLIPNINQDVVDALIKHYDLGSDANVNTLVVHLGGIMRAFGEFIRKEENEIEEHSDDFTGAEHEYVLEGKKLMLEKMRMQQSRYSNHFLAMMAANTTVKDLYL